MWQFSHSSTVEWFSQVWEICRWSNFLTETSRSYLLTSLIPSLKVRVCKQCRPKVGSWGTWLDWLRGHFSVLWLDRDSLSSGMNSSFYAVNCGKFSRSPKKKKGARITWFFLKFHARAKRHCNLNIACFSSSSYGQTWHFEWIPNDVEAMHGL